MFQIDMIDYYRSKLKDIEKNYALALEKNDHDGVHDLRVSLKRLRAFFNLVESITQTFNAKRNFKNFRRFSKHTGGLRDSQVQQEMLNTMNDTLGLDLSDYMAYLKKKENDGLEQFLKFSEGDPIGKLKGSKKQISRALQSITAVCVETKAQGRFQNQKSNLIILSREEKLEEEILHKVRILSKEVHYTLEIIQKCLHMYEDRTDFIEEIKKVHQLLGKWHDYDVCLAYLDEFLRVNSYNNSTEPYHKLANHIRKEKRALHKKSRTVLDEFTAIAVSF